MCTDAFEILLENNIHLLFLSFYFLFYKIEKKNTKEGTSYFTEGYGHNIGHMNIKCGIENFTRHYSFEIHWFKWSK